MSHHPNNDDYLLFGLFGLWLFAEADAEEQEEKERLEKEEEERLEEEKRETKRRYYH